MKGYIAANLKDMNRKTVYDLLSSVGEMSRAEISRQTGISSPTVIKIINFFLENGFVLNMGEGDSYLGRKPQIIRFNSEAAWSIGVEFEGGFLKVGMVDLLGNIKCLKNIKVNPVFDEIIKDKLPQVIDEIIKESNLPREKILGIGIGIPGVVDPESLVIDVAPLVGIYDKADYKEMIDGISNKIRLPIFLENDANAASWGEFIYRKMDRNSDLLYISLGTGLGSGIIVNGRIRRGANNSAGEIGYMTYEKSHITSKVEPGWLEKQINLNALNSKWGFCPNIVYDQKHLIESSHTNEMIDFVAAYIALCIVNICIVIDVSTVVLGGITIKSLGEVLIARVKEYLQRMWIRSIECGMQMSSEPGVVGAASIVTNIQLKSVLEG